MDRKQPRPARQHQHQQVFRYIELRCLWEERLTAGHLQQLFSISRDSASKRINEYIALCPGNLRYDASLKGYFPTDTFAPEYSQGSLEEYIHDFIGADMQGIPAYNSVSCFPMQSFERRPDPEIVRPILQAISQNNRIDIAYTSVTNPDNDGRIISPHSLIHDGARWHVRAWCEKNQGFRDFVVSRIREVWGKEGASEKSRSHDRLWETILTLTIQPDVRLTPAQQEVIALEYGMQKNENGIYQRSYPVRAALLLYTLNHLRLDRLKENAEAQQIMLTQECQREITPYLPRA